MAAAESGHYPPVLQRRLRLWGGVVPPVQPAPGQDAAAARRGAKVHPGPRLQGVRLVQESARHGQRSVSMAFDDFF